MHFIHIGRNKSASTTLQRFLAAHVEALDARAHDVFVYGRRLGSPEAGAGRTWLYDIAKRHADAPHRRFIISDERLMARADGAASFAWALKRAPARIIAYIRDYPAWVRSFYAQNIIGGYGAEDFDTLFDREKRRISAISYLRPWAAEWGWRALHVRALHPSCLAQGDVICDFVETVGLPEEWALETRLREHVSPPWPHLEIARAALSVTDTPDRNERRTRIVEPIFALLRDAFAVDATISPIAYLTAEQDAAMRALWSADSEEIADLIGVGFHDIAPAQDVRAGPAPSIADLPSAYLRDAAEAARRPDFASSFPIAAKALRRALS